MDKVHIVRWLYNGYIPPKCVYKDYQKALDRADELNKERLWYQRKIFRDTKYVVQTFDVN
jgi:hypothetical protein